MWGMVSLAAAAEGLVEVDYGARAGQVGVYLAYLCRQQALLCGEHFKIIGAACGVEHKVFVRYYGRASPIAIYMNLESDYFTSILLAVAPCRRI